MAIERTYIIPLRREWLRVPEYKRAKRAVAAVKNFLMRHMKQHDISQIKLGTVLNEELWSRGMKNPPSRIKVNVVKEDDGLVKAELFGHKYVVKKKIEKKEEDKSIAGKLKSALGGKEEKKEEKAEEKKEEPEKKKTEEKKEAKKEKPAIKAEKAEEKKEAKKPAKKEGKKPSPKPKEKEVKKK